MVENCLIIWWSLWEDGKHNDGEIYFKWGLKLWVLNLIKEYPGIKLIKVKS